MADKKYTVDNKDFDHLRTLLRSAGDIDAQIEGLQGIREKLLTTAGELLDRIETEQEPVEK